MDAPARALPRRGLRRRARRTRTWRSGPAHRVHELQQEHGALVALALERPHERVELGYGLVELHTASRTSGSLSSMVGLKPSPQPWSSGSTSITRTSAGKPPRAPHTISVLSSEITPVTASDTRACTSRAEGSSPSQRYASTVPTGRPRR